jgi:hypothetical protein
MGFYQILIKESGQCLKMLYTTHAMDYATIALSLAKDCRICIFELDLPDDEVEDDYSCENMEDANCIRRDVKLEEIKRVYVSNDLSMVRGYFINLVKDRDMFAGEFSERELAVASLFNEEYVGVEEFLEWDMVI